MNDYCADSNDFEEGQHNSIERYVIVLGNQNRFAHLVPKLGLAGVRTMQNRR